MKTSKKLLCVVLVVLMCVSLIPESVFAASDNTGTTTGNGLSEAKDESVSGDESGDPSLSEIASDGPEIVGVSDPGEPGPSSGKLQYYDPNDKQMKDIPEDAVELNQDSIAENTSLTAEHWYYVDGEVDSSSTVLTLTGDANIVLLDGCELIINRIFVAEGDLYIWSQRNIKADGSVDSVGKLTVNGGNIGAVNHHALNIYGGNIQCVDASTDFAVIGAGGSGLASVSVKSKDCGDINIKNAHVSVAFKDRFTAWSACIGAGRGCNCGNILIMDCDLISVTTGWYDGCGIGGGFQGTAGNILISECDVVDIMGYTGRTGIGGGDNYGSVGNITIIDSSINYNGDRGYGGIAIGGGSRYSGCGDITIKNCDSIDTSAGSSGSIGGGDVDSGCGNIIISSCGSIIVSGSIGGGDRNSPAGDITIKNCDSIDASAGSSCSIGGGFRSSGCGNIIISSCGSIIVSGSLSAGIGGGYLDSPAGDITISDCNIVDVTAGVGSSDGDGAGIGGGNDNSFCKNVTIEGCGTITVTSQAGCAIGNGDGENRSAECDGVFISGNSDSEFILKTFGDCRRGTHPTGAGAICAKDDNVTINIDGEYVSLGGKDSSKIDNTNVFVIGCNHWPIEKPDDWSKYQYVHIFHATDHEVILSCDSETVESGKFAVVTPKFKFNTVDDGDQTYSIGRSASSWTIEGVGDTVKADGTVVSENLDHSPLDANAVVASNQSDGTFKVTSYYGEHTASTQFDAKYVAWGSAVLTETSHPKGVDSNEVPCYDVDEIIKLTLTVTINKSIAYKSDTKPVYIRIGLRDGSGNWLTSDEMKSYSVNGDNKLTSFEASGKTYNVERNKVDGDVNYTYIRAANAKNSINAMTFTVEYRHTVTQEDVDKGLNYVDAFIYHNGIEAKVETKECSTNYSVTSNQVSPYIAPPEAEDLSNLKIEYYDSDGTWIHTDTVSADGTEPYADVYVRGWVSLDERNIVGCGWLNKAVGSGDHYSNLTLSQPPKDGLVLAGWSTAMGGPVEYGYIGDMYTIYRDDDESGDFNGDYTPPYIIRVNKNVKLYAVWIDESDYYKLGYALGVPGAYIDSDDLYDKHIDDATRIILEETNSTANGATKYWQSGMFSSVGQEAMIGKYIRPIYDPKHFDMSREYGDLQWICWYDKHNNKICFPGETVSVIKHEHTLDAFWANTEASNKKCAYDGEQHSIDAAAINFVGETKTGDSEPTPIKDWLGDNLSFTTTYTADEAEGYTDAGIPTFSQPGKYTYYINTIVKIKRDGSEYEFELEPVECTLTITYTLDDTDVDECSDVVYDGLSHRYVPVVTRSSDGSTLQQDRDYVVTYRDNEGNITSPSDPRFSNVSSITVTIEGRDVYSGSIERTYKITPAAITITADDQNVFCGDRLPDPTAVVSGKPEHGVEPDYTVSYEIGASSDTAAEYEIIVNPGVNPNYTVTPVNGTLTVKERPKPIDYELTINFNGGNLSGGYDPLKQRFNAGASVTLTPYGFGSSGMTIERTGAVLIGYSPVVVNHILTSVMEVDEAVSSGAMLFKSGTVSYTMPESDTTLYCLWAADDNSNGLADMYEITVYFDAENGSVSDDHEVYGLYDAAGMYAINGSATVDLSGIVLTPDDGYITDGGYWTDRTGAHVADRQTVTKADDGSTFTYHFAPHNIKLSVTKVANQTSGISGDTVTWTVTAKNTGNVVLKNIVLEDLMDGVTLTGANGNVQIDGNKATILELAPGASESITVSYVVKDTDAGGKLQNTLTYCSELKDPVISTDKGPEGSVTNDAIDAEPTPPVVPKHTTFHLDANGGEFDDGSKTKDVTDPSDVSDFPSPSRDGYDFKGWYENGKPVDPSVLDDGKEHHLEAQWEKRHTIFHLDAGDGEFDDGSHTRDAIDPPSIDKLPTPTRDGYELKGWYENGKPVDPSVLNDGQEHDLKAEWEKRPSGGGYVPPSFRVKFDSKGGSNVPDQWVSAGSSPRRPEDPTKPGYVFDGWYTEDGELFDFTRDRITSRTKLYAKWSRDWSMVDDHIAYIVGYPDGLVHPNDNITRAEVAEIFYRLLKRDIRNQYRTKECSFVDIPADAWYTEAVATLANLGIVVGKGNDIFDPEALITRAEFATIVVRFDHIVTDTKMYFDDVAPDHWAYDYIGTAAQYGWIVGRDDRLFHPDDNITRAEAITLVNRALGRDHLTLESIGDLENMKVWPDNADVTKWYYLAIQEATNGHNYLEIDEVEYWHEITGKSALDDLPE